MFRFLRRDLRVVVDCADARRLRALRDTPRPRGVRARCRVALQLHEGRLTRVMRAEIVAAGGCTAPALGAWLAGHFTDCDEAWYVDGIAAREGGRPSPLALPRLRALFAR